MNNKLKVIERKIFQISNKTILGKAKFVAPHKFQSPLDNEARYVHVINGHSNIIYSLGKMNLKSGDSLIMKSGNFINNWLQTEDGSKTEIFVFQFFPDVLREIYENKLAEPKITHEENGTLPLVKLESNEVLNSFNKSILSYINNPEYLTEEVLKTKIKELIMLLTSLNHSQIKPILQLFHPSEHKLQEIVQANLFENLTLEELAFLSEMSPSTFQRKFKSIYGTSPKNYIINKRLERAKILLESESHRVSEVAFECGFEDVSHFSKSFSSKFGISPRQFRDQL